VYEVFVSLDVRTTSQPPPASEAAAAALCHAHHSEQHDDYLYDVYTAPEGAAQAAVGITDGLCQADGNSAINKTARERHFPHELLEPAMAVELELGHASVQSDRVHILNAIARTGDLDSPPPQQHAAFAALNAALRGRIAAGALRIAVEQGGELLRTTLAVLKASALEIVHVDFSGECVGLTPEVAEQVVAALPPSLTTLELRSCRELRNADALRELSGLRRLGLREAYGLVALPDLSACAALSELDLTSCDQIGELPSWLASLGPKLHLNLTNCSGLVSLPDLSAIGEGLTVQGCTHGLRRAWAEGGYRALAGTADGGARTECS
jgi:hypothetical protein